MWVWVWVWVWVRVWVWVWVRARVRLSGWGCGWGSGSGSGELHLVGHKRHARTQPVVHLNGTARVGGELGLLTPREVRRLLLYLRPRRSKRLSVPAAWGAPDITPGVTLGPRAARGSNNATSPLPGAPAPGPHPSRRRRRPRPHPGHRPRRPPCACVWRCARVCRAMARTCSLQIWLSAISL